MKLIIRAHTNNPIIDNHLKFYLSLMFEGLRTWNLNSGLSISAPRQTRYNVTRLNAKLDLFLHLMEIDFLKKHNV